MSVPQITWCLTGYCIAVQCDCYFIFFSDVLPLINKIRLLPHPPSSWFLPEMSFINKPQQLCEDVCTPVLDSCIDCCCVFFPSSSSDVHPSQHTSDAPQLPWRVDYVLPAEGLRELQQRQWRKPHGRRHGHLTSTPPGWRLGGLIKCT